MNAYRILLFLLMVASLAVDLLFLALVCTGGSQWPDAPVAVLLGLAGGQINLATVWGVLGFRHAPWRMAALVAAPVGWGLAISACSPEILSRYVTAASWVVHFFTQTALLGSILFLLRIFGARLLPGDCPPGGAARPRLQFTLRYLFAWLTATAIVLSLLKTTFNSVGTVQNLEWPAILVLGLVSGMLGLSGVWLILDGGAPSRRTAAVLATLLPAACAATWVVSVAEADRLFAAILLWFIAGSYSAVAWTVLGVGGARLAWLQADGSWRS